VAVIAVVAFHAGAVRGGFVGVDVFFVISGFLITRLLWAELAATGRIGLPRFFAARARRLLPAAGVVLVVTAAASAVLLPPLQAHSVLNDGLASALYVGNYRLAITGTDYLGHTAPSPFQHYWSLGVEEQFYLLWPLLMVGVAALAGHRRRDVRRGPLPYFGVLAIAAAGSFLLSWAWTRTAPPWAFFSLPTRAWELAAGGLLALSAPWWRRMPALVAGLVGVCGLVLIGWAVLRLDQNTAYPGMAALLPVSGTALVIAAGCAIPVRGAGRLLSSSWMRAVGRLSYSWYLWHWPVLLFIPVLLGHPLGWTGRAVSVAASFALAVLTLRYVEQPVRSAVRLRRSAGRSLALGSAITAAAVCAALALPMVVPASLGRGVPASTAVVYTATDRLGDAVASVQTAVAASATQEEVPAALTPPLARAAADKPAAFVDGCVRSWQETGVPLCESGDTAGSTTVALVGDSHAAMWQPALEPIAAQSGWRLLTMTKTTCPLQDVGIFSPYLGRDYTECAQWRGEVLDRLEAEQPRLIVVSMSRRYGADFGFTSYDPAWIESLAALVAELRSRTGARVLVLGPAPDPHSDVPVCLSAHLDDAVACAPVRSEALFAPGVARESAATIRAGGQYADLAPLFCTTQRCPVIVGANLVYRDDNHITVVYARAVAPVLGLIARDALAPPS